MENTSKYLAYAAFALATSSFGYGLFQTSQICTYKRQGQITEAKTATRNAALGLGVAFVSTLFGSRKLSKSIDEEVILTAAD